MATEACTVYKWTVRTLLNAFLFLNVSEFSEPFLHPPRHLILLYPLNYQSADFNNEYKLSVQKQISGEFSELSIAIGV